MTAMTVMILAEEGATVITGEETGTEGTEVEGDVGRNRLRLRRHRRDATMIGTAAVPMVARSVELRLRRGLEAGGEAKAGIEIGIEVKAEVKAGTGTRTGIGTGTTMATTAEDIMTTLATLLGRLRGKGRGTKTDAAGPVGDHLRRHRQAADHRGDPLLLRCSDRRLGHRRRRRRRRRQGTALLGLDLAGADSQDRERHLPLRHLRRLLSATIGPEDGDEDEDEMAVVVAPAEVAEVVGPDEMDEMVLVGPAAVVVTTIIILGRRYPRIRGGLWPWHRCRCSTCRITT